MSSYNMQYALEASVSEYVTEKLLEKFKKIGLDIFNPIGGFKGLNQKAKSSIIDTTVRIATVVLFHVDSDKFGFKGYTITDDGDGVILLQHDDSTVSLRFTVMFFGRCVVDEVDGETILSSTEYMNPHEGLIEKFLNGFIKKSCKTMC
jgi:hypothetical protein